VAPLVPVIGGDVRRRKLLVALAALAGVVVLWPRGEPDRITQANFDRIHEGMTRAEVETILGPPGDYRTEPAEYGSLAYLVGRRAQSIGDDYPAVSHWWEGNTSLVILSYDHSGRVTDFGRVDAINPKPSAVEILLWHLKRQWHRWFPEWAMRRWKLLVVLAGLAVVVVAGAVVLRPRPSG
jgi:hypothetical protein